MLGTRLAKSRQKAGLTQAELAAALGDRYDHSVISRVENNQSSLRIAGLICAAKELKVSADYLVGLTDDPMPATSRSGLLSAAERISSYTADGETSLVRPVEILEVAIAAGPGSETDDEVVTGRLWFRSDWLAQHGIDPARASVVRVYGDSMEPTLFDGCSVLVDRSRREPREDRIFALRTEEGPAVKRLAKEPKGWWQIVSDNPDYPPLPARYGMEIIGEVRWVARTY